MFEKLAIEYASRAASNSVPATGDFSLGESFAPEFKDMRTIVSQTGTPQDTVAKYFALTPDAAEWGTCVVTVGGMLTSRVAVGQIINNIEQDPITGLIDITADDQIYLYDPAPDQALNFLNQDVSDSAAPTFTGLTLTKAAVAVLSLTNTVSGMGLTATADTTDTKLVAHAGSALNLGANGVSGQLVLNVDGSTQTIGNLNVQNNEQVAGTVAYISDGTPAALVTPTNVATLRAEHSGNAADNAGIAVTSGGTGKAYVLFGSNLNDDRAFFVFDNLNNTLDLQYEGGRVFHVNADRSTLFDMGIINRAPDFQFGAQSGSNPPWYTRARADGAYVPAHLNGVGDALVFTANLSAIFTNGVTAPGITSTASGDNSGLVENLTLKNTGTQVDDGALIQFTSGTSISGPAIGARGKSLNSGELVLFSGNKTEFLRGDVSQNAHFAGGVNLAGILAVNRGGSAFKIGPGTENHAYMEFYAKTALPNERSGYIGYGGAGSATFTISNDYTGGSTLFHTSQGDLLELSGSAYKSLFKGDVDLVDGVLKYGGSTLIDRVGNTNFNDVVGTGKLSVDGGAKIGVQNKADGGPGHGLFWWDTDDNNWGTYMGSSGAGRSLTGSTACTSLDGRMQQHIRNRVLSNANFGYLWENSQEQCLMSLTADTGRLHVKENVIAANFITPHTAGTFGVDGGANGVVVYGSTGSLGITNQVDINVGGATRIQVTPSFVKAYLPLELNGNDLQGVGKATLSKLNLPGLQAFADDAAAAAGGLLKDDVYKTSSGELRIKL